MADTVRRPTEKKGVIKRLTQVSDILTVATDDGKKRDNMPQSVMQ